MRYTPVETFTDKFFYLFDASFQWANRLIKSNPRSFIDVETIEDNETLVMSDGSLMTAVNITGVSRAVLEEEFVEILDEAERKLMAYMSDGCHCGAVFFDKNLK